MTVRVRFAPSPTGDLHEGGAMVAVANHLLRLKQGGVFVLRIDDTDNERYLEGAEERIRQDLAWLGIAVDEGPDQGPHAPYRQSLRADQHLAVAEQLVAKGTARRESDGAIVLPPASADVTINDLSRGAIRIPAEELGATVLVRSNGLPTYHLANVVDDHTMAITHVLRGEDHIVNSARQLLLCAAMGVEPPQFAHLPIVVGDDGARLSKRSGAVGVAELHAQGWLASAVVDWLARSACPPVTALPAASAAELAQVFDPTQLGHGTTKLDPILLGKLGRDHLALLGADQLAMRVLARLEEQGARVDAGSVGLLAPGLGDAENLQQAADLVLGVLPTPDLQDLGEGERAAATALIAAYQPRDGGVDLDAAKSLLDGLGVGKRSVRRVLTAADRGIPLPFVLAALSRDEVLARAQAVLDRP